MPTPSTRIDRTAFVVGPQGAARVQRLNAAVRDAEILPVIGRSGTGKDAFLQYWWQVGCCETAASAGQSVIRPEDIVLVSGVPAPAGSTPVGCAVFTKIWLALLEAQRARDGGERPRPQGRAAPCHAESITNLIYKQIYPLMDDLQPLAIAVSDAGSLNSATLRALLELRTPTERNRPRMMRCALILCATVDEHVPEQSRFSKLLGSLGETRAAWPNTLTFAPMNGAEFGATMAMLIRRNLRTDLGEDVKSKEAIVTFADWTGTDWWLMVELVKLLDEALGPQHEGQRRVLTQKVIEAVRQRWLKRRPTPPPQLEANVE